MLIPNICIQKNKSTVYISLIIHFVKMLVKYETRCLIWTNISDVDLNVFVCFCIIMYAIIFVNQLLICKNLISSVFVGIILMFECLFRKRSKNHREQNVTQEQTNEAMAQEPGCCWRFWCCCCYWVCCR